MIPRKSVVSSIECLQRELVSISGELKVRKQKVTLGVKNNLLYYVVIFLAYFQ